MRSIIAAVLFAMCGTVLAQTPPRIDEKKLSAIVGQLLKDPDSLKLRNVRLHPSEEAGSWHLCGEYNAKNSSGGYVGFSHFVGTVTKAGKSPAEYVVRDMGDFANSFCASLSK